MEEVENTSQPQQGQQSAPTNPLLQRIRMPGETFTLPSGGLFYHSGELDESVKNAEIHVYPMTAIDEITIKTPDLLFSGDAVRQVFARCIPQVKNVDALLVKDVDFLLVCLRKVSYGEELTVEHKHNCKDAKNHSYIINVTDFIRKAKRIDPTKFIQEFSVTLPNGQVVLLQPLRYKDYVDIMQFDDKNENDMSPEQLRDIMINSMSNVIVKVDDVEDQTLIREWLAQVQPSFLRKINEKIQVTLEWGPEFTTYVKCLDCDKMSEVTAPLNPLTFFT